jgi:hypothetical protein
VRCSIAPREPRLSVGNWFQTLQQRRSHCQFGVSSFLAGLFANESEMTERSSVRCRATI